MDKFEDGEEITELRRKMSVTYNTFKKFLHYNLTQVRFMVNEFNKDDEYQREIEDIIVSSNECLMKHKKIILVGCGKSFKIASKISAMLNSLSMNSVLLHPTDAIHGDMGTVQKGDCLWLCSSSGETQEIVQFMDILNGIFPTGDLVKVGITRSVSSSLGRRCDYNVVIKQFINECDIQQGLKTPTISTSSMLIVMDCLVMTISELYYQFNLKQRRKSFNLMHPGGEIGLHARKISAKASSNGIGKNLREQGQMDGKDTDTDEEEMKKTMYLESYDRIHNTMDDATILQQVVLHDYVIINGIHVAPSITVQDHFRVYHKKSPVDGRGSNFYGYLNAVYPAAPQMVAGRKSGAAETAYVVRDTKSIV